MHITLCLAVAAEMIDAYSDSQRHIVLKELRAPALMAAKDV